MTSAFASSDDPPYEISGSVMPVSGISLRLPAAMMNAWTAMTSASPAARRARKSSCAARRRSGGPRSTTTRYRPRIASSPIRPELLAQRRERVVRVDRGDRRPPRDRRQAGAEPDAEEPAARERVERLDHLEAGAHAGRANGSSQLSTRVRTWSNSGTARTSRRRTAAARRSRTTGPAGRHVQEREEHGEEQQGGAEVASGRRRCRGRSPTSRPSARGTAAAAGGSARCGCSRPRAAAGSRTGSRRGTRRG